MPWQSKAQQRWGHSASGERALGGPAKVAGWDSATNFKGLPARKGKPMMTNGLKGYIAAAAKKRAGAPVSTQGTPGQRLAMSKSKKPRRIAFRKGTK